MAEGQVEPHKGGLRLYDRELQQQKTMDPEFGIKDLRFLELRGESTSSLAQKELKAAEELEAASFKKFELTSCT